MDREANELTIGGGDSTALAQRAPVPNPVRQTVRLPSSRRFIRLLIKIRSCLRIQPERKSLGTSLVL